MRMRNLGLLAAVALVLSARPARAALDAPHDQTFSQADCTQCHELYQTTPAGDKDFSYGCVTCHNSPENRVRTSLGFPWDPNGNQAVPGVVGNQHSWTGYAENARYGAQTPANSKIASKLLRSRLQCATCHDIHASSQTFSPGSRHTSFTLGEEKTSGTSKMILVDVADGNPRGWRVKLQAGNTFIISHNAGVTPATWLNYVNNAWVPGVDGGQGKGFTIGQNVGLDPDPLATVKFTAATPGDTFDFYVSYPHLRTSNVADALCTQCHADRVMNHVKGSGKDPNYPPDGSRVFSHPVNVALDANGAGYDRPLTAVLDADGGLQPVKVNGVPVNVGDGRTANDLKFDAGVVRCTTCHAVHNGASNSLTN